MTENIADILSIACLIITILATIIYPKWKEHKRMVEFKKEQDRKRRYYECLCDFWHENGIK